MANRDPVPQSAVIAYRRRWWRLRIILVTSRNTRRWVLPKGHIEAGYSPRESAAKEAFEEAGIEGIVGPEKIGTYRYTKSAQSGRGVREVDVYPMAVTLVQNYWQEMDFRHRKWMSVPAAIKAVEEPELKKILATFQKWAKHR